jgi:hypothetical protein
MFVSRMREILDPLIPLTKITDPYLDPNPACWQFKIGTCFETIHSGVIDTAVICTALSLTPLWHVMHIGVNDAAVTCTAVSMTPLSKYDIAMTLDFIFERL